MPEFVLDTSGRVECAASFQPIGWAIWPDLTPFERGYVEAMLSGWIKAGKFADEGGDTCGFHGFSDLAPETLAMVRRDCEMAASILGRNHQASDGEWFWNGGVRRPGFPPLTPYLGDDGKVYLS